jgi:hypothetical protein
MNAAANIAACRRKHIGLLLYLSQCGRALASALQSVSAKSNFGVQAPTEVIKPQTR